MAKPSTIYDRIKELEAEKTKLMEEATATALANAQEAIAQLNQLGFNYRLTQDGKATRAPRQASTGTRRSGIRDQVLAIIQGAGADGINRSDLLEKLEAKGDKTAEQSISNAISALKKANAIAGEKGNYTAS
jgi:hypothetical protein